MLDTGLFCRSNMGSSCHTTAAALGMSLFQQMCQLPQLIELWGLNVQTEVESRKNLAKVSGK